MKKFNLRIACFSLDDIHNYIEAVENTYKMTIKCHNASAKLEDSYNEADVLFINISEGKSTIEEIIAHAAPYAECILYTDEASFKALDSKFIEKFMDVWFSNDAMISYRATKFIKEIHEKMTAEFIEKQLNVLADSLPDLIWCKDLDGLHLNANASFCFGAGKTKEQVLGRDDAYIWNIDVSELAEDGNDCLNTDDLVIKEQGTHLFDEQVKFGEVMHQYKTYKSAVIGRNGESIATIGLARDVTDIWNTHEDFKKLISSLPIPTLIVNAEYGFVAGNKSFEEIFDYPQKYKEDFNLEHFGEYFFKEEIIFNDSHNTTAKLTLFSEDKSKLKYFAVQKSAIYNVFNVISGYFYIFTDITEDFEKQEYLSKLAEIDELSQINNRKGLRNFFSIAMPKIIESKESLAVFMIDIDYFKKYNDFYGHLEGDKIIKKIAALLEESKREDTNSDNIYVARFGGEEFVVAIRGFSLARVKEVIRKIEINLSNAAIEHKSSEVCDFVTLSVGIAYYNTLQAGCDISEVMQSADDALYKSKEGGRNKHTIVEFN